MSAATIIDSSLPDAVRPTVRVEALDYFYGEGDSHNQVLFDNRIEIGAGQFVVMTGPSGAGKTTLLTLIGMLRSAHKGRIEVLGQSLSTLGQRELVAMRRNVGFIFQMHNLFDALSAYENVKMAMQLSDCPVSEMRHRGSTISRGLYPGASASASRSPGRSSINPNWFSPTSRPPHSTGNLPTKLSIS